MAAPYVPSAVGLPALATAAGPSTGDWRPMAWRAALPLGVLLPAPVLLLAVLVACSVALVTARLTRRPLPGPGTLLTTALAALLLAARVPLDGPLAFAGLIVGTSLVGALVPTLDAWFARLLAGTRLPPLTLAAALVGLVPTTLLPAPAATVPWLADPLLPTLPVPLGGFLAACAAPFALPYALPGGALLALLAWRAPRLALFAAGGFAVAVAERLALGHDVVVAWSDDGNPLLAAVAVGALLRPAWRGALFALLAALAAALLADALAGTALQPATATTLPAVFAAWAVLAAAQAGETHATAHDPLVESVTSVPAAETAAAMIAASGSATGSLAGDSPAHPEKAA